MKEQHEWRVDFGCEQYHACGTEEEARAEIEHYGCGVIQRRTLTIILRVGEWETVEGEAATAKPST